MYAAIVNEAQLQLFVARLRIGEVEPRELVKLTTEEFEKILGCLKQHKEVHIYSYMRSLLVFLTGLRQEF